MTMEKQPHITVIGAGLAGCEAAWAAAQRGVEVTLIDMKPQRTTPAHHAPLFAELVCSNSLKAKRLDSAAGLLKEEMRRLGSVCVPAAFACAVPAGGALAVDREQFAEKVTKAVRSHPRIAVEEREVTALPEEVEGAVAEGAELLTLQAPVRVEANEAGSAVALWTQPQVIGVMDSAGRPRPNNASADEVRIPADVIIIAIGQGVESHGFEQSGVPVKRGMLDAMTSSQLQNMEGVFAGGDCVTGPATAIRAIAAGKVAAANIDEYLGFHHEIDVDVEIPSPKFDNKPPHGRINIAEREASVRKHDFHCIECTMSQEEANLESSRCLRCDHFGYGNFKGGRVGRW